MLDKTFLKNIIIFSFLVIFCFLLNGNAQAENTTRETLAAESTLVIALCNSLNFITGTFGRTLASLVVIAVGFGFFTGKLSWGTMIATALGVAVLFGAPTIVNVLTGEKNNPCQQQTSNIPPVPVLGPPIAPPSKIERQIIREEEIKFIKKVPARI